MGTKAERRAARAHVTAYHEARLGELIEYITAAVDRYPRRKRLRDLRILPRSDARLAATSSRRVVTRTSDYRGLWHPFNSRN